MKEKNKSIWRKVRAAVLVVVVLLLIAVFLQWLKGCAGSERRVVPSEVVLQVVIPPPAPPPPPPPPSEPEEVEEQAPEQAPEPAQADAPAAADAPGGDNLFAGGADFGGGTGGTGFGRPQDYLRQELEKCLRLTPALQRARLRRQAFNLTVGAERRVSKIERTTSTGRDELDRLLDEKVEACVGAMPVESRFVPNSRFVLEINKL